MLGLRCKKHRTNSEVFAVSGEYRVRMPEHANSPASLFTSQERKLTPFLLQSSILGSLEVVAFIQERIQW